jgi:ATP-dependent DNA helicase RecQ
VQVHAQVLDSPDSYYQEVGRAGRDGAPAQAVLLYRPEDLALARYHAAGVPPRDVVRTVLAAMQRHGADVAALVEDTGLSRRRVGRIVNLVTEVAPVSSDGAKDPLPSVDAVVEQAEAGRRLERSRVEMMRAYAETTDCRRGFMLGYFGETQDGPCGACDTCRAGTATVQTSVEAPYDVGDEVNHQEFGTGTVMDLDDVRVTVLFADGYRTLDRDTVEGRGLLEAAGG